MAKRKAKHPGIAEKYNKKIEPYLGMLLYLSIALGAVALLANIVGLLEVDIYLHDSLYYMANQQTYDNFKLPSEGRWLNYILFDLLVSIPGRVASITSLLSFAFFGFYVGRYLKLEWRHSLLLALLAIEVPSHYSQLLWPATVLPSYLLMIAATALAYRLNRWLYYMLFGALFFGSLSQYYYLLPLLFLGQIKEQNLKELFIKTLLPWGVGYIVGYMVANGMVYYFDHKFITLSVWRHPHPIDSFRQLVININHSILYFGYALDWLNYNPLSTFMMALAIALLGYQSYKSKNYSLIVLLIIMAILHHIIITSYGVGASHRALVSLYMAIWVMPFVLIYSHALLRLFYYLFLVVIFVIYGYKNYNNSHWFGTVTHTYVKEIKKAALAPPNKVVGVVLVQKEYFVRGATKQIERYYNLHRSKGFEAYHDFMAWETAALTSGYRGVAQCTPNGNQAALFQIDGGLDKVCKYAMNLPPVNPKTTNLFFSHQIIGGRQVISFNPRWKPE